MVKNPSGLCHGAHEKTLREIENKLGIKLPQSFLCFLAWRDGGFLTDKRFIIYSAGKGVHPEETLLASNQNRPLTYPLFNIARDATYEFGFKKDELNTENPTVYAYIRDYDELDKIAETFEEFLSWMERKKKT